MGFGKEPFSEDMLGKMVDFKRFLMVILCFLLLSLIFDVDSDFGIPFSRLEKGCILLTCASDRYRATV